MNIQVRNQMTNFVISLKKGANYKLLLLFLCLCLILLLNSYFDPNGYLSPDSTYYLRLSKNLLTGEGFRIADYQSPDGESFFAIWPVGYPILIFLMSKLTGLGIVWASKVLNLVIIGVILLLFRYIFRKNAYWVGLIFFIDAIIELFSFTWSEGPFILFLFCIPILLYKTVETNGKIVWLSGLLFSGIALFMMRYIGLVSAGIIGLIALTSLFRKRWRLSIRLLIVAILQLIFAGVYLYHNKIASGFITGMPRALPEESNHELLNQLISALKDEFLIIKWEVPLLISLALLFLLSVYLFKTRSKKYKDEKFDGLWKYFLLTGILYYVTIIGARWFSNIEPLYFRFLAPGTFLIILSVATYLQGKPGIKIMNSTKLYLLIVAIFTIHHFPNKYPVYKYLTTGKNYFSNLTYSENNRAILEKYKDIPPKSVVIFGSIHLRYLRKDIIPTEIYGKSTFDDMIKYFTKKSDWNVYINIKDDLDPVLIHDSYIQFMEANKDKQVVKVK